MGEPVFVATVLGFAEPDAEEVPVAMVGETLRFSKS
jgi:hypothetical protein